MKLDRISPIPIFEPKEAPNRRSVHSFTVTQEIGGRGRQGLGTRE
jgi:hypothetical protein